MLRSTQFWEQSIFTQNWWNIHSCCVRRSISCVGEKRKSHLPERCCVNHSTLTHRNTRWRNIEQQKYRKTHLKEAKFITTADWLQLLRTWPHCKRSRFHVFALQTETCVLFPACAQWDQSKTPRISKPDRRVNVSHRIRKG